MLQSGGAVVSWSSKGLTAQVNLLPAVHAIALAAANGAPLAEPEARLGVVAPDRVLAHPRPRRGVGAVADLAVVVAQKVRLSNALVERKRNFHGVAAEWQHLGRQQAGLKSVTGL